MCGKFLPPRLSPLARVAVRQAEKKVFEAIRSHPVLSRKIQGFPLLSLTSMKCRMAKICGCSCVTDAEIPHLPRDTTSIRSLNRPVYSSHTQGRTISSSFRDVGEER
eukprot:scaffold11072_cov99-Skeletonema_dohrnii-CCMP3373.AAC.2